VGTIEPIRKKVKKPRARDVTPHMNDALLLPKLRHTRWIGWTEVAGRDLFDRPMASGLPRVGVGEDTPERFTFVAPDGDRSFDELETIAIANLRKRPVSWSVKKMRSGLLGLGKKPIQLQLIDEWACERLLDRDFLGQAHRLLDQEVLAVAAPARGLLYAAPGIAGPDPLAAFLSLAERAFVNVPEDMEPISPAVFTVQQGRLTGVILGHPQRTDEIVPARGFPWPTRDARPRLREDDLTVGERLQLVGYSEPQRSIEYSCYLEDGARIPEREVERLGRVARARALPDGRPLDRVRVVFLDRQSALRGQAQLGITGATILFMGDDGLDAEL
jgi:hypothetical protein